MALILVIEREQRYIERIQAALSVEGYRLHFVGGRAEALQAAASEAPDLVIASAEAPGVEALAVSFARRSGGPGVVAMMPESLEGVDAAAIEADEFLIKPFGDDDLRQAVRRSLAARRDPARARVAPADDQQLTSKDIFGDVLAEVEDDLRRPAAPPSSAPQIPTGFASAGTDQSAIERKLEQTLSGVLGVGSLQRPKPPAPAAKKSAEMPATDVEALLSKTLGSLQMGGRAAAPAPRPSAPVVPPPAPSAAAPATPARPAAPAASAPPPPPRPSEGTGVRSKADLDFAALEQLARPARPATLSGVSATPPVPPAAAPRPLDPPVQRAPVAPPPPVVPTPEPLLREIPPPVEPPAVVAPPTAGATVEPAASSLATQRIPVHVEEADDRRFGQYTLLERIAVGGMAEVWKARMRGLEGFQKTVAIKKILPHMTHNSEFVSMFIDEAKLAAQLSHPNIIHIYDLGKIANDYFIAMEYVEGRDLRTIGNLARQKRLPIPVGLSLLIAHHLAGALDHAHRKRDFEGRALGLVHRDVSPQNVLISRDGDIKLCDFGIAKAVTQAGQTQIGALKGKLQYMSPEQAWGRPVDARSDVFSLGTLLFEMLTGERLFAGDSEISVLEAVREGRVRSPREIDPSISAEIDAITRRALAHDPADRFQSAGEMEQRLGAVLYEQKPTPSHTDLAAYVRKLEAAPVPQEAPAPPPIPAFPPAPASAPPVPVPAAAPVAPLPPFEAPVAAFPAAAASAVEAPAYPAQFEEAEANRGVAGPVVEAVPPLEDAPVAAPSGKSRVVLWVALAALIAAALAGGLWFARGKAKPQAAPPAAPGTDPNTAAATPSATAPADAAAPALQTDLTGLVGEAYAKRQEEVEKELQKQYQEKERKLREQMATAASGAEKSPAPAVSPSPAPSPAAPPPAAPEPEPEERRPEPTPEPPKVEERRPEPPAPAPRETPREEEAPRVREGDLVEPGPGVNVPQLVSAPKPGYPALAKQLGVEGVVVLSVLVDENGRVQEARLVEPIKQKVGINESALAAARGAKYRPATKGGVRVKMWTRLRIPFKL